MRIFIIAIMVASAGVLASTPYEISSVCPGDQITLTCSSSIHILQWSIILPTFEQQPVTRLFTSTRQATIVESFEFSQRDTIVFHFLRRSDFNTTPLVTSLIMENIPAGANGTNVSCRDTHNEEKRFMIIVIDNNTYSRWKLISYSFCMIYIKSLQLQIWSQM